MRNYAIDSKIPQNSILVEEDSLDTVGQAIFTKRNLIIPKNIEEFTVISHDYHGERVKLIFDFVYGNEFNPEYFFVPSSVSDSIRDHEKNSIQAFLKTFKGVSPGNLQDILMALVKRHPFYKEFKL